MMRDLKARMFKNIQSRMQMLLERILDTLISLSCDIFSEAFSF